MGRQDKPAQDDELFIAVRGVCCGDTRARRRNDTCDDTCNCGVCRSTCNNDEEAELARRRASGWRWRRLFVSRAARPLSRRCIAQRLGASRGAIAGGPSPPRTRETHAENISTSIVL